MSERDGFTKEEAEEFLIKGFENSAGGFSLDNGLVTQLRLPSDYHNISSKSELENEVGSDLFKKIEEYIEEVEDGVVDMNIL